MSYFLVLVPQECPPDISSVPGIRLLPMCDAQQYVAGKVRRELKPDRVKRASTVVDETGDTASDLVSEVQKDVLISDLPFEETRLGLLIDICSRENCGMYVWWAHESSGALGTFEAHSLKHRFADAVLAQLTDDGFVEAAFLPV